MLNIVPLDPFQIRDPPPEGELFIYGVHLWGCGYEKTATLDLQDIPPKSQVPTPLPLLHLSVAPKTEQQLSSGQSGDSSKGPFIFQSMFSVPYNSDSEWWSLYNRGIKQRCDTTEMGYQESSMHPPTFLNIK